MRGHSFNVRLEYRDRNAARRNYAAYWFDADTMRFFRSRLSGVELWTGPDRMDCIFTTSEKPPHGPRMYSIRHLDRNGDIETVGEFCAYSRSVAIRMARELVRQGRTWNGWRVTFGLFGPTRWLSGGWQAQRQRIATNGQRMATRWRLVSGTDSPRNRAGILRGHFRTLTECREYIATQGTF